MNKTPEEKQYLELHTKYKQLDGLARDIKKAQGKALLSSCVVMNVIIVFFLAGLQAIGVSANTTWTIITIASMLVSPVAIYFIKKTSYSLSVLEDIEKKESEIPNPQDQQQTKDLHAYLAYLCLLAILRLSTSKKTGGIGSRRQSLGYRMYL